MYDNLDPKEYLDAELQEDPIAPGVEMTTSSTVDSEEESSVIYNEETGEVFLCVRLFGFGICALRPYCMVIDFSR